MSRVAISADAPQTTNSPRQRHERAGPPNTKGGTMLRTIREWLCRHDWQTTKFQALVPGIGQQCTKCGKHRQIYPYR
jgi:hypothetical protein